MFCVIAASLVVGEPRPFGVKGRAYQAAAHLWVGFLLGGGFFRGGWHWWAAFAGLCAVELACFLWFKFRRRPAPSGPRWGGEWYVE